MLNTLNLYSDECHFSIKVEKKNQSQETRDKKRRSGSKGEQRGKPTNTLMEKKMRHTCWFTLKATGTRGIPSNSLFYSHLFSLLF